MQLAVPVSIVIRQIPKAIAAGDRIEVARISISFPRYDLVGKNPIVRPLSFYPSKDYSVPKVEK